jgi:chromosome segregation ATPase
MISLEQVKLLETKVTKTIEHVKKVTEENTFLKGKLDSCQQRIDELEVLIKQFKDEQNRIEEGILSALDRLNEFEDALESTLNHENSGGNKPKGKSKNEPAKPATPPVPDPEENPWALTGSSEPADSENPVEPEDSSQPQGTDNELDIF